MNLGNFGHDNVIVRDFRFSRYDKLAHCTFPKNKVRSFCLCFSRSQLISVWDLLCRFPKVCEIMPASCTKVPTVIAHVEETLDHGVI